LGVGVGVGVDDVVGIGVGLSFGVGSGSEMITGGTEGSRGIELPPADESTDDFGD
jgi:hypothetical protein